MNKLNQKRKQVLVVILTIVMGNSILTAAPSFQVEITKNTFLTFANILMFIFVWDAYFAEKLSLKGAFGILKEFFSITIVGITTTFIVYKIICKAISSLILTWGTWGWLIGGGIGGMATATLGIVWACYCDDLYRNSISSG